jgi:hypothetical protein
MVTRQSMGRSWRFGLGLGVVAIATLVHAATTWVAPTVTGSPLPPAIQSLRVFDGAVFALGQQDSTHYSLGASGWSPLSGPGRDFIGTASHRYTWRSEFIDGAYAATIRVSTDDGATWSNFGTAGLPASAYTSVGTLDDQNFYLFVFDAATPNFAGKLYRAPHGTTAAWTAIDAVSTQGSSPTLVATGGKLFAGIPNSQTLMSADQGATWTSLTLTGSLSDLIAAGDGALYALDTSNRLHRNASGGTGTWTMVSVPVASGSSAQGLCLGGDGSVLVMRSKGGLTSTTGAAFGTFSDANTGALADLITAVPNAFGNDCVQGPDGTYVSLAGFGVFRDTGSGFAAVNTGLPPGWVDSLGSPGTARELWAGVLNAGLYRSTDAGGGWARLDAFPSLFPTAMHFGDGFLLVGTAEGRVYRSTDGGTSFTETSTGLPVTATTSDGRVYAFGADASALYLALGGASEPGVHKSTDGGLTWQRRDSGMADHANFIRADTNGLVVYADRLVATTVGRGVFVSTDGAATWTRSNSGLPIDEADDFDCCFRGPWLAGGTLFLGKQDDLFRSTDRGATWTSTGTGLPPGPYGAHIERVVADASGDLYALEEHAGWSASTDGGATWFCQSEGVPFSDPERGTRVRGLAGLVNDGELFVASAQGVLRAAGDPEPVTDGGCAPDGTGGGAEEPVTSVDTSGPGGVSVNLTTSAGSLDNVTVSLDSALGVTPPAGVSFPLGFYGFEITGLSAGASATVTLTFPAGTVIDGYWKFGPEPGDASDHVWQFTHDGTTGAQISGNTVTLTLVDGGRGDADGVADGVITDPGAPALGTPTGGGGFVNPFGSGSGGCTLGVPGQAADPTLLVLALLALAGLARRRRARA